MTEDIKSMDNQENKTATDVASKVSSETATPAEPAASTKPAEPTASVKPTAPTTPVAPVKPAVVTTAVETPQPVKEVKPVTTENKDPKGEFDYSNCKTYTVKEGQTLLDVANDVLVAYQQLRYFNHLNKFDPQVHAGQVIYIPNETVVVPLGK